MSEPEPSGDLTPALVRPLVNAMNGLEYASRHLHPPDLAQVIDAVMPLRDPLIEELARWDASPEATSPTPLDASLRTAAAATLEAYDGFAGCVSQPNALLEAYRSLRFSSRAAEALYDAAPFLRPISQFFLDHTRSDDEALLAALAQAGPPPDNVGVTHVENARDQRGGYSLYVPEYYDEQREWPLVVALHGGSGHGRDFVWSWLRDARTFGAVLLSATSRERTWSLMGPDIDSANLTAMIERVAQDWRIDASRILLTGMSDGGTFALISAMRQTLPATHFAPFSASFHPSLLGLASAGRPAGLPIYLTHGALDWMFPVAMARAAHDSLNQAGADLVYREIADLSHTYPREENARILAWLSPPSAAADGG